MPVDKVVNYMYNLFIKYVAFIKGFNVTIKIKPHSSGVRTP